MAIEIERKFLVSSIPWKEVNSSSLIKQGYLMHDTQKVIRIRQKDDDFFITIKGNTEGISRLEFEYIIPEEDARDMLKYLCGPSVIEKTRHYIKYEDHMWEVDEFHNKNKGLIIAEIELKSEDEKFQRPEWVGDEVSHDSRYYNMNLMTNPYENWKK